MRMYVQRNDRRARTHEEIKRKDILGYLSPDDPKTHRRRLDLLPNHHMNTFPLDLGGRIIQDSAGRRYGVDPRFAACLTATSLVS
jgi:hypothetical protein